MSQERACVLCADSDRARAPGVPQLCSRCYWGLAAPTRAAYQQGTATGVKQLRRASRDQHASVRNFGGGRKR